MRCPSCGGYSFDSNGKCKFCGFNTGIYEGINAHADPDRPPWFGSEGLKPKNKLARCNKCGELSFFWNWKESQWECLNLKCKFIHKI
jgi:ribosomal protein L37E